MRSKGRTTVSAVVLLGACALGAPAAAEEQPVRVHVFARTVEPLPPAGKKLRVKETEEAQKRAEQARKDLEKALRTRHGKRSEAWPPDARESHEAARLVELQAVLSHQEAKAEQDDLLDAAGRVANSLQAKPKGVPAVAIVETADQADLTVEVLARRAKTSFPAAAWRLYLKVAPVGFAERGAFVGKGFAQSSRKNVYLGQIMGAWDMGHAVTTIHPFTEAEPFWSIEVYQQGTGWGDVAYSAAEILAAFANDLASEQAPRGALAQAARQEPKP